MSQDVSGRVRLVQISNELLTEILRFPPGTTIVGYNAVASWENHLPDLELKVTSPDFSQILPGTSITRVHPTYRRVEAPGESVEFVSW